MGNWKKAQVQVHLTVLKLSNKRAILDEFGILKKLTGMSGVKMGEESVRKLKVREEGAIDNGMQPENQWSSTRVTACSLCTGCAQRWAGKISGRGGFPKLQIGRKKSERQGWIRER